MIPRARSRSRAFTMIELVIVLVSLGLVVGIAAPRLVGSSASAQARDAARGLADTLTAQRAETIRSMKPSRLFLVSDPTDPPSIRLVGANGDGATESALETALTQQGSVDEPFALLGVWSGVGGPTEQRRRTRSLLGITIEPTGRVRLDQGGEGFALVVPDAGGTIWWVGFDPISGTPSISRRDRVPRS